MTRRRAASVAAVACSLAAIWAAAPAAADVSGPSIVGFLNLQRAAQGVPAGIVEDPVLSDGCAKHNAYGRLNNQLVHAEDPVKPGYTAAGHQAAQTSVLYAGSGPWTAGNNPFELAPIHLHQLLAPRIDRMGASENQGYGCATTLASRNRPAPAVDVTYTYPGANAKAWPTAQVASEGPYTPGERVGIPAGTRTGPYLYVMFDGPDLTPFDKATSISAALTGPDGPVAVAIVDNGTSGLENFLPTGMQVIPRAPLKANAVYTATVAASVTTQGGVGPPRAFGRTWSFATGTPGGTGSTGDGQAPAVTISKPRAQQKINVITTRPKRKRTRIKFAGKARDASGMRGAYITVEKLTLPKSTRCRWLDPKKGLKKVLCSKPIAIEVKLSINGAWTYTVPSSVKLSTGSYRVRAYGLDKSGSFGNSAAANLRSVRFTLK